MGAVYLLQFAVPTSIVVHYWLNRDFIEQNFCINIDQPEMNCHGQCHMQKQISKVTVTFGDSSQKEIPSKQRIEINENIGIFQKLSSLAFGVIKNTTHQNYFAYLDQYESIILMLPTPPPRV